MRQEDSGINASGVSIPNRDFNELQFILETNSSLGNIVSIPNRDFNELQLLRGVSPTTIFRFQSLIGILMNCNVAVVEIQTARYVSIPNRDFNELQ